ncbi:MAG: hypothetical protein AAGG72_03735 [Pseudomonadota bacterium]
MNLSGRTLAFAGVIWPAKQYNWSSPGGGAANLDGVVSDDVLQKELDNLKALSDAPNADQLIENAKALVGKLEDKATARDDFVQTVLEILADDEDDEEVTAEQPTSELKRLDGRDVIDLLGRARVEENTAPGGAAGLGDLFSGLKGGVMNFLNMTTYWKMKQRAGRVGKKGVHNLLGTLHTSHPGIKRHLVGHSFGGRLLSAAVRGPDNGAVTPVNSLSLLQSAFSHHGFADQFEKKGYFRRIVDDEALSGPILVTHTSNDTAVGLAYPLASRLHSENAAGMAALGDKNDEFGGIGRNGAQKTTEATDGVLLGPQERYDLNTHSIHNLLADDFIRNHGDVRNPAVANMVLNGIDAS